MPYDIIIAGGLLMCAIALGTPSHTTINVVAIVTFFWGLFSMLSDGAPIFDRDPVTIVMLAVSVFVLSMFAHLLASISRDKGRSHVCYTADDYREAVCKVRERRAYAKQWSAERRSARASRSSTGTRHVG